MLNRCLAICLVECLFFGVAWAQGIHGTVVDDKGEPVSGVVIYAVDSGTQLRVRNNEVVMPEKFPRVLSDANGSFAFQPFRRSIRILLVRDIDDRFAWLIDPESDRTNKIVIPSSGSVTGQLWRGKSPLPDKEITAVLMTDTGNLSFTATARTDPKGRFVFDSLPPGIFRFQTICPVPQVGCCFRSVPTRDVEVRVCPAQSHTIQMGGSDLPYLRGKITDTEGEPLHGVWVYLKATNNKNVGVGSWSDITTKNGGFAIYDIPPGPYILHCFRRLARNNYSRTLQTTQPVIIKDRLRPNTSAVVFAENIRNIAIDLNPFMPLKIGRKIPPFKSRTLTGDEFDIENERGKIVILHFYAGWCRACGQDFPVYDKLCHRFGPDHLSIVGINLDNSLEACQSFLKNMSSCHPQLFAGPWADSPAITTFHIANVPTTIIVDEKGTIIQNDLFGDVLETFIAKHLSSEQN